MDGERRTKSATLSVEERQLLPKPPSSGSEGVRTGPGLSSELPQDIVERSVRRVGIAAALVAGGVAVEGVISHLLASLTRDSYPRLDEKLDLAGVVVVVAVSVLMVLLARSQRLPSRTRRRLGFAYFLVVAYMFSLTDHADHFWRDGHRLHGVASLSLIIVAVPVIVPMPALRALAVALLMAATGPLAQWTLVGVLSYQPPSFGAMLDVFPLEGVGLAVCLAWIVHQLGMEVKRARQLGAYTLDERLGSGGMGEVWKARHRFLARPAAVKLIRAEMAPERLHTAFERFEREAQTTAALRSPHTIELYDFGATDDRRPYYVMELLDGLDLDTFVERFGPQPPERVIDWLRQACHSLREAHARGLVHRDIKPANLFVCRYGADYDFVKVLDFGLVAWGPAADTDDARLTADGRVIGTPAYMPPEMATSGDLVDARSDLYALGCVAYWLLTGGQVFAGGSPIEVILGHVDKTPAAPSELSDQVIPEELDRIVLACLAKAPEDRPASADALLRMLDQCQTGQEWTQERARDWWEAHLPERQT